MSTTRKSGITGTSNRSFSIDTDGYNIVLRAENNELQIVDGYNNSVPLSPRSGGVGQTSYTLGDILYASSAVNLTPLSIGSEGFVLKSIGGIPSWGSAPTSDHNSLTSIQGGSGTDGYYHLTHSQHVWLTDGYSDGYWNAIKGGTGHNNYLLGDILYANSTYTLNRLPIGGDGYVLKVSGSVPVWGETHYSELIGYAHILSPYGTAVGSSTAASSLATAAYRTLFGYQSGTALTTGTHNTLIGSLAGNTITTGNHNVALGASSLTDILDGYSDGDYNVAVGSLAGNYSNATSNSVFIGRGSGSSIVGDNNIFVGSGCGQGAIDGATGANNTAIGRNAMISLTSASDNNSLGAYTFSGLTSGGNNNAVGTSALLNVSTGSSNIAMGTLAGAGIFTANSTISIGRESHNYSDASGSIAIGHASAQYSGAESIFIGYLAGTLSGTSSDGNIGIGSNALRGNNSTNTYNIGIGYNSGYYITTGSGNIFLGQDSGYIDGYGSYSNSIAIGNTATNTGTNSIAIGANVTSDTNIIRLGNSSHTDTYLTARKLHIGDGTANSMFLYAETNAANKPGIQWNNGGSVWQYTNDGYTWQTLTTHNQNTDIGTTATSFYVSRYDTGTTGPRIASNPASPTNMEIRNAANTAQADLASNSLALHFNSALYPLPMGAGGIVAISDTAAAGVIDSALFGTVGSGSRAYTMLFTKARGTYSMSTYSPSAVQNGDQIMKISCLGYDGYNYLPVAQIKTDVINSVSSTDVPARLSFTVGHDGNPPNILELEETAIIGRVPMHWDSSSGIIKWTTNIPIGNASLNALTTGTYNVSVGANAGDTITDGYSNINIGAGSDTSGASNYNSIAIGRNAIGKGSNTSVIGTTSHTDTWIRGNNLHIGNESASDGYILFENGDVNKPGLRYNDTANNWQLANDGSSWSNIVSDSTPLFNITAQSTTYNAIIKDCILATTTSPFTITLPTAVGVSGKQIIIKKVSADANALTIHPSNSQTIDGSGSDLIITAQYNSITLISDGSNWWIV